MGAAQSDHAPLAVSRSLATAPAHSKPATSERPRTCVLWCGGHDLGADPGDDRFPIGQKQTPRPEIAAPALIRQSRARGRLGARCLCVSPTKVGFAR
jgi:hypothetical protein